MRQWGIPWGLHCGVLSADSSHHEDPRTGSRLQQKGGTPGEIGKDKLRPLHNSAPVHPSAEY